MHLEQGQIWNKNDVFLRIITWGRLSIEYKSMKDLDSKEGTLHLATKKEFCRLLKGAVLHVPEKSQEESAAADR